MQIYKVGGAVRDRLLGIAVTDIDRVVVGATTEQMLAKGYRPVGSDFPVFLDPNNNEEYALARTERKSGRGYGGFVFHASPEVTLEQDLIRRDLTINAMAEDDDGNLTDPYNGQRDLQARVLRHVSRRSPKTRCACYASHGLPPVMPASVLLSPRNPGIDAPTQ